MKAGWEVKTIDEIAEVKGGKRLPKGFLLQSEKTEHPYITVSDFTDDGTIDLSKIRFISKDIFEQIKRYTISAKDIYISIAGTIGKTGRVPPELDGANLTENACKLVLKQNIERDFIYYFTKSQDFFIQAGLNTRTAAQPKLALERLKTISLAIPTSLEEQQRIVVILDQAFEGIAKARANAEQNLKNARALFESYLQSVFTQRGEGWIEKTLIEVCEIKPPKNEAKKILKNSDFVSFAPMEDLGINQKYLNAKKQRILEDVAGSYTYFAEGDVLLAKITPCFENGKLGIAKNLINGIGFGSSEYIVFRPNKELSNEFLYYFLSRKRFIEEGAVRMSGAVGHKRVSKEFIEGYKIAFPLLDMQKGIVRKIDDLSQETQRLEALYQRKIELLDELKKSLLQQAFAGEL